ncbi:MAG TPA: DUF885 domain-containing protein, partial [Dokdonella sp.]
MRAGWKTAVTGLFCLFAGALAGAAEPASPAAPAWVARSNADAEPLLTAIAEFHPEFASRVGVPGYDEKVVDMQPGVPARERTALEAARTALQS